MGWPKKRAKVFVTAPKGSADPESGCPKRKDCKGFEVAMVVGCRLGGRLSKKAANLW